VEDLAGKLGDEAGQERYRTMADVASSTFNRLFWNDKAGCLYDVRNRESTDASIRPNQIFAVSLTHSMLLPERARGVVEKVQEHLLTPYGLRSLAPSDPQYRGRYFGDPVSRDGAYHQGTVWPWLIGPFITGYVKVHGGNDAARRQAAEWLAPLKHHLCDAGLGHISEIFDGDPPHCPRGCIAQAWSVAEVLRAYVEDVKGVRPAAHAGSTPAHTSQKGIGRG
jgi:glycogen debranching enzyme